LSDVLRKEDWFVASIPHKEAAEFIREHHYSKGCSLTSVYRHGLFKKKDPSRLMGVAIWLPPTKPAAESVNKEHWKKVLSLTRMAVVPECPRNSCSFLLSRSIKAIKAEGRFVSLVTYADERVGHDGLVYKAANWKYIGKMKGSPAWIDPKTNRQVAIKSTVSRTYEKMRSLGYVNVGTFGKHKFVYHLESEK
jgi:hypothetical protein